MADITNIGLLIASYFMVVGLIYWILDLFANFSILINIILSIILALLIGLFYSKRKA